MDKATKIAVEKYPHGTFDGEIGDSLRAACAVGYMQAEKDLSLTWEDVMFISQTVTEIINSIPDKPCPYTPGLKEICEETLKRFNKQKKK